MNLYGIAKMAIREYVSHELEMIAAVKTKE
jgi:hypothetical protein